MADCPTPYRLRVLQKLTAILEGITPLEGYEFNLSKAVFRGRDLFGADAPTTMLSILESPRPDYGMFVGNEEGRAENWVLLIQGTAPLDERMAHPLDRLYYLADEVQNRLYAVVAVDKNTGNGAFPELYMLGRDQSGATLISGLEIGPPVVRPPTDATQRASFYLALRVGLAEVFS